MQRILCWLGLHDWVYNDSEIRLGTERVCRCCDRKELFTHAVGSSDYVWYRIR